MSFPLQWTFRAIDLEPAAPRHRVARVDGDVEDHLLELSRVYFHHPRLAFAPNDELDVLAQDALQHGLDVEGEIGNAHELRLHQLLSGEGQELPRQIGGAARRLGHLLDVAPDFVVLGEPRQGEVAVTDDRGEKVVEVVGDAAGQESHRFHLLRLAELLLESEPLGHVPHEGLDAAVLEPLDAHLGRERVPAALSSHVPRRDRRFSRRKLGNQPADPVPIPRRGEIGKAPAEDGIPLESQHVVAAAIGLGHPSVSIRRENTVRRLLDERAESFLALVPLLFGPSAFRHHRSQEERRHSTHVHEAPGEEEILARGARGEGSPARGGSPDRHSGSDEVRRSRAVHPEAERGPHQEREREILEIVLAEEPGAAPEGDGADAEQEQEQD